MTWHARTRTDCQSSDRRSHSDGDYVDQLNYLLFLRACPGLDPGMADERSRPPYNQLSLMPAQYAWPELAARDGDELFDHYRHALKDLDNQKGLP